MPAYVLMFPWLMWLIWWTPLDAGKARTPPDCTKSQTRKDDP